MCKIGFGIIFTNNNNSQLLRKGKTMSTLAERIVRLLEHNPGMTDREITDLLNGHSAPQQPINQKCHALKDKGVLVRRNRSDGLIGNYLTTQAGNYVASHIDETVQKPISDNLSEDDVKRFLEKWLVGEGWQVQVAWGHSQGVDIEARQGTKRWVIEVKGCGSRSAMRVNYFIMALGELLQRMDKPDASYSVAFPDMQQFRRLWERLPALAKKHTGIRALFVDKNGNVVRL
jgi:cytochrome c553